MLASLQVKTPETDPDSPCIKFQLLDHTYRVTLQQLRDIFGFEEPTPGVHNKRFRPGVNRAIFWEMITGQRRNLGWKDSRIQHPLLRIIHRVIATTIYGRVGTLSFCNTNDLYLMDFMLRPTATRPDLARCMIDHWVSVRDQKIQSPKLSRGPISVGSLLIHLARSIGAPFQKTDALSPDPILIDFEYLSHAQMVKRDSLQSPRTVYLWQLHDRHAFPLPYQCPFDLHDPSTYLIPADYDPAHHPLPAQQAQEVQSTSDPQPDQEDLPSTPSAPADPQPAPADPQPDSPPAPASAQTPPGDVYEMFRNLSVICFSNQLDLQTPKIHSAEVLSAFEHLQADVDSLHDRLTKIQRAQFEQTFFTRHGHWPRVGDLPSSSSAPPPVVPRPPEDTPMPDRTPLV